jgi:hypothetical protein
VWEIRTVKGRGQRQGQFAFATYQTDDSPGRESELDAWECREEFFGMAENDNAALLRFLTKVGAWNYREEGELLGHWSSEVMQHYSQGNPIPVDVRGLWKFRDSLRHALVDKWLPQTSGIEFALGFDLTGAAAGVVTIKDAYHLLLATVFVDVAKKIRFKICQREDCGKTFPLQSKHKRKFCSWDCAHITTVRRNRHRVRGKKKARKALR